MSDKLFARTDFPHVFKDVLPWGRFRKDGLGRSTGLYDPVYDEEIIRNRNFFVRSERIVKSIPVVENGKPAIDVRCTKAPLLCKSGITFSHHEHACVCGPQVQTPAGRHLYNCHTRTSKLEYYKTEEQGLFVMIMSQSGLREYSRQTILENGWQRYKKLYDQGHCTYIKRVNHEQEMNDFNEEARLQIERLLRLKWEGEALITHMHFFRNQTDLVKYRKDIVKHPVMDHATNRFFAYMTLTDNYSMDDGNFTLLTIMNSMIKSLPDLHHKPYFIQNVFEQHYQKHVVSRTSQLRPSHSEELSAEDMWAIIHFLERMVAEVRQIISFCDKEDHRQMVNLSNDYSSNPEYLFLPDLHVPAWNVDQVKLLQESAEKTQLGLTKMYERFLPGGKRFDLNGILNGWRRVAAEEAHHPARKKARGEFDIVE